MELEEKVKSESELQSYFVKRKEYIKNAKEKFSGLLVQNINLLLFIIRIKFVNSWLKNSLSLNILLFLPM